jgi:predicted transcriptional regulator
MKCYCHAKFAVKTLLPPVRAAMAKHLMTKYDLKQVEAAKFWV